MKVIEAYKMTLLGMAFLIACLGTYWIVQEKQNSYSDSERGVFVGRERVIQEEAEWYTIEAHYPADVFLENGAKKRVLGALESATVSMVRAFKEGFSSPSPEDIEFLASVGRKHEQRISYIPYRSEEYVSYAFQIYEDMGGVHPNSAYRTLVFDMNGNGVMLADLFIEGSPYLELISVEVRRQIKKQLSVRMENSSENLLFEEGVEPKAENFGNFVVDEDTLVFLIPPYQVAPYVAGSFEVKIPLKNLKDVVRAR
ncbi:MAG TPA: RsiV family protein [Candidatus Paceibacterota bacterium]